jgi:hypothetical protein
MQAIMTKYIGPTNSRGSRIKAWCSAGSVTIDYPHQLSNEAVYWEAAKTLIVKLGWQEHGNWIAGGLPNSSGYCFVCPVDYATFITGV